MSDTRTGSCFCKAIRFEITGKILNVANCHCSKCRKLNGSPFSTYAIVSRESLRIVEGADRIAAFSASPTLDKHFCPDCGTPIYNAHTRYPTVYMTHLGALDDPAPMRPQINIYCSSMLEWVSDIGQIQSFPEEFKR